MANHSQVHDRLMRKLFKPLKDKEKMFPGSTNLTVKNIYKKPDNKEKKVNEVWPYIATAAGQAVMRALPYISKAARNPAAVATAPATATQSGINMYKKATSSKKDSSSKPKTAGPKGYSRKVKEEAMTTADAGIPQDTKNMGPSRLPMNILRRKIGIPINVTDRRRKKDKPPKLRKKFRSFR